MLRYESPVENTITRWVAEDTEWDGSLIQRGQIVLATLLSANRDERQFPNPDTFDITREPNKHIAFGQGIHYCLGAPLARLEGAIAINTLLRRVPNLALSVPADSLEWNDSIQFRGLKALPIKV
jgi:cytochrome P450 PksS